MANGAAPGQFSATANAIGKLLGMLGQKKQLDEEKEFRLEMEDQRFQRQLELAQVDARADAQTSQTKAAQSALDGLMKSRADLVKQAQKVFFDQFKETQDPAAATAARNEFLLEVGRDFDLRLELVTNRFPELSPFTQRLTLTPQDPEGDVIDTDIDITTQPPGIFTPTEGPLEAQTLGQAIGRVGVGAGGAARGVSEEFSNLGRELSGSVNKALTTPLREIPGELAREIKAVPGQMVSFLQRLGAESGLHLPEDFFEDLVPGQSPDKRGGKTQDVSPKPRRLEDPKKSLPGGPR